MKKDTAGTGYSRDTIYDPIPPVAQSISEQTSLLCFDEFQVFVLLKMFIKCYNILYSLSSNWFGYRLNFVCVCVCVCVCQDWQVYDTMSKTMD